jgi:hypothetical protein
MDPSRNVLPGKILPLQREKGQWWQRRGRQAAAKMHLSTVHDCITIILQRRIIRTTGCHHLFVIFRYVLPFSAHWRLIRLGVIIHPAMETVYSMNTIVPMRKLQHPSRISSMSTSSIKTNNYHHRQQTRFIVRLFGE